MGEERMALSTREISYPEEGVNLGEGWDSLSGEGKKIIGITFNPARDLGQSKEYRISHSTERNKMMNELEVSVEAQYKYLAYKIGAKAKFSDKVTTSGTFESFTTWANVKNGAEYTAPIPRDQSSLVASLIAKGKKAAEINKALDTDPIEYSKIYPLNSSREYGEAGVWLTDEAVNLAKKDREAFRRKYGDFFVQTIYGGAQLNVVMTFKTSSRDEQQKIAASLEGSGWGLDIKAEAVATMEKFAEQSKLEISYYQLGGSGDVMPTDVNGFLQKIQDLPNLAASNPYPFRITLKRYDSLPNWPAEPINIPDLSYGQIVRRLYEYRDLYDEIDYIKENSDDYILGKDWVRDGYPGITLKSLEDVQDELHQGIRDLIALLEMNKGHEDSASYQMPPSASKPDYEFRIAMPLPLNFVDEDVQLNKWNIYKEMVGNKWIRPISTIRGKMYSEGDPGCLTNAQIHEYESKVYYLAIVGGKIEVPGRNTRIWGDPGDIEKAQEIPMFKGAEGGMSSFYFRAMPGYYKLVVGIGNPDPNELFWGKATDKKEISLRWNDEAYLAFYLGSPGKDLDYQRIVGGLCLHRDLWGFITEYKPVWDSEEEYGFYIGG